MRILVANRGEIAVRIIAAAHAEGHDAVAVYSDADVDAMHVGAADHAVRLGAAPVRESYLNVPALIAAAQASGADAVHPGYGFLAENADFAAACIEAGLTFIGPSPESIALMGDKAAAKRKMAELGVPILPGYQGEDSSDATLLARATDIGVPLMVKAAAGGGGKGMRLVTEPGDVPEAIAAARREALGAFGSDALILERAVLAPRHVEIQVLADQYGTVLAFGERDCTVQRRHQKVVEEAPSPALTPGTRSRMAAAAISAAAGIGYVGAGTVEFLLDTDGSFAFLEMNTRIQVEHPVTELVHGVDLVSWQLRIAEGDHLPTAEPNGPRGHAMEARLYAEGADFLPSSGTIVAYQPPAGAGIRVDSGIRSGNAVPPYYDPMLAKVVAFGEDREQARRRLVRALEQTVALGVSTNRSFLLAVLADERFVSSDFSTAMLAEALPAPPVFTERHVAAAALAQYQRSRDRASERSPDLAGWSSAGVLSSRMTLCAAGTEFDAVVIDDAGEIGVWISGDLVPDPARPTGIAFDGNRVLLAFPDLDLELTDTTMAPRIDGDAAQGSGRLVSPFHGTVAGVLVAVGDHVPAGTPSPWWRR
ncbi:acetyl/propionyl/methylcrotonyl-CoA carboxylase subunit alpha [Tsukamurella sp. PLM1]|uniref:acetyl-CoA carboxylase biotin carboxylase subunit n=1 Tax=Tsukamurella sp. PLM1 TaxID=2929795 RepID=UPI0020680A8E|nr:biotin carboxylase N-terminal domain-containing protein [Tsukamurella sp. PLM1]BDH59653.1 geranyl-CoA carboxylase subunit alpha [Tsukamurella sp. PLM1]